MGRYAEKWSEQQRRAIVSLVLDDGMTCEEAVAAAANGAVPDVEAFEMPPSTAREIVLGAQQGSLKDARAELGAHAGQGDALTEQAREIYEQLVAILEGQLGMIAGGSAERQFGRDEYDDLRAFARCAKEVCFGARHFARQSAPRRDPAAEPELSPAAAHILERHRQDGNGAEHTDQ